MINLPDITYVHIDGRQSDNPDSANYVEFGHLLWPMFYAEYAKKYFNFAQYLIITPDSYKYSHRFIQFKHTNNFNYNGYSIFMIRNLDKYIDTEYCLVYQADGAIFNPQLWNDNFLQYDYIGAPWGFNCPIKTIAKNITGNGGFSLRSKKFLTVSSKVPLIRQNRAEDVCLLMDNRQYLMKNQIKIPDSEFARTFSVEYPLDNEHTIEKTFGFHEPKLQHSTILQLYRQKILKELNYVS